MSAIGERVRVRARLHFCPSEGDRCDGCEYEEVEAFPVADGQGSRFEDARGHQLDLKDREWDRLDAIVDAVNS